jgi:hypothetical protein
MERNTRWSEPYPPPPTAQSHSSWDGCSGSGCQRQSTVTGVPNLPLQYGRPFADSSTFNTYPPPQSNGLVERFHRRFKDALRARAAGDRWITHLPWVRLGIRSAWREGSDFSPAEAVCCAQPILPSQYLAAEEVPLPFVPVSDLQGILTGRTLLPTTDHSTPAPIELPEDLLLLKHVLVHRDGHVPPLAAAYDGPFLVLGALSVSSSSRWETEWTQFLL